MIAVTGACTLPLPGRGLGVRRRGRSTSRWLIDRPLTLSLSRREREIEKHYTLTACPVSRLLFAAAQILIVSSISSSGTSLLPSGRDRRIASSMLA